MTDDYPKAMVAVWPKAITIWQEGRTGLMSVPFTWCLLEARGIIEQGDLFIDQWRVGGPAVDLMPDYLADTDAIVGGELPGVLQRVNPYATRTTLGCPRRCKFCGIGQRKIEPSWLELEDWPDLPILCDNNLLASSEQHFDRVFDRLEGWGWCDFNQGLDARFLTDHHAERLGRLRKPVIRLALDDDKARDVWATAFGRLRRHGVAKSRIRSYVLCGFTGGPEEDWRRCEFVESHGVMALPMWFHELNAMHYNRVTPQQTDIGWTKRKQRELFCWYYQHRTLEARG